MEIIVDYCVPCVISFVVVVSFYCTISRCNNRSELEALPGSREDSPSRKEATHATDDTLKHWAKPTTAGENIGWEKRKEHDLVFIGIRARVYLGAEV